MEIGCSSGEMPVSVTLAENFLWLFQSQGKDFYHEINRKWGHSVERLNPRRTETSLQLVLVCLLD